MDSRIGQPPQAQTSATATKYDISNGGHYGAAASVAAAQGFQGPELLSGTWANVGQGLNGQYRDILTTYWQQTVHQLENESHDYKMHHLPLARIKKVMKADPDVKMISAEAPILFAKGCDIFITELTMRAWIHAEENKRRTLQRSDIASALAKSDMFDFLIDIVPREEASGHNKRSGNANSNQAAANAAAVNQAAQNSIAQPPQQNPGPHPQHQMGGHQDYQMANNQMPNEPEYRAAQPGMYAPQVPGDPNAYGQPQQPIFDQQMYGYGMTTPQQ